LSEEIEEPALTPSKALYGTGVTGTFSDSLSHRYLSLLAVAVGVTVSQMSYLRAAESLSRNILQLLWGRLVDRKGKRSFIAIGRFLNGIVLASLVFVEAPVWVMLLMIGVAICWSIITPAWSSLLGDYTTYSGRGEVIGRISALSQTGSLGAMIGAFLISINQMGETTPESFKLLLAVSAVMSIVSGAMSLFIEEKPPDQEARELDLLVVFRDLRLRRYLTVNVVYGIGMSFAWPLFPFIIVNKLSLKIWQVAAFSIFSAASSILSQRYSGKLMDRIGRRPVVVFSRVIMAVSPLFYVVATNWVHIAMSEIIMGLGMGAWMSSGPTYIIDLAPVEMRATYLAANTAVFGVATFIGNLLGGYVTDNFLSVGGTLQGINTGLMISAGLRFLIGLLFFRIHETYPASEREPSA
jgi:MFS family permease